MTAVVDVEPAPGAPTTDSSARLGRGLVVFWTIASAVGTVWWLVDPFGLFFATGAMSCLVVSVPLARGYASPVSPWTLVAAITYVGCGIRGAAISAHINTADRTLSDFLLLNRQPGYFVVPSLLYLSAVVLLTVAFMVRPRKERAPATSRKTRLVGPVVGLALPLAMVGGLSFLAYVRATGGFNLASISAKRTTINGLQLDQNYSSHGELLFLNNLSTIAFWIVVAHYVSSGRRISLGTKEGWLTGLLALNAVALPFYASSRSDALLTLLGAAGIATMLRPGVLPVRGLLVSGAVALVLVSTMTHLRSGPSAPGSSLVGSMVNGATETFVYSRNLADPTVAAHLYHAVPGKIPYQDGATIYTWALAPVPRAIWPGKPIVNFGPLIGNVIYGNERSGVPPGWVGDLYVNWGLPSLFLGSALLGWLLAQLDRWRLRQVVFTPAFAVLYVPLALTFTKNLMSKGIGAAVFNGGTQFVLTALCLVWISSLRPRDVRRAARRARSGSTGSST